MEDDNMIPLSYISQYGFCRRRVGLLMLEQQWSDSTDTVKGSAEHNRVHNVGSVERNDICTLTDMQVVSHKMNLIGRCDAVEAIRSSDGIVLPFVDDCKYVLYPIEYKHGKLRSEPEYELQLCAQAMCLEEMFGCHILNGAIFFISSHRRKELEISKEKREEVKKIAASLSEMLLTGKVPSAVESSKCIRCSIKDICMPDVCNSVIGYMKQLKKHMQEEEV